MLNCHLPMFLTNSYKNCKLIGGIFLFLLHLIFIYECMTNINHTPFERGENFLSIGNKIFFLQRIHGRDMTVDILYCSFIKKSADLFGGCLSFLLCHFIYTHVIKISYIQFERRDKDLSFDKKVFLSASFYRSEIGVNILCHYFCIVCYNLQLT